MGSDHIPRIEVKFNPAMAFYNQWQVTYFAREEASHGGQVMLFASGFSREVALSRLQKEIDRHLADIAAEKNKEIIEL